jgi:hypothetical protein
VIGGELASLFRSIWYGRAGILRDIDRNEAGMSAEQRFGRVSFYARSEA